MKPIIRGKPIPKNNAVKSENLMSQEFEEGMLSMVKTAVELEGIKKEIIAETDKKLQEVDAVIEEAKSTVDEANQAIEESRQTIEDTREEALQAVRDIKQGEPGKDADEESIVGKVLAQIPVPEKIDQERIKAEIIASLPKFPEENTLVEKVLKSLPENRPSLKVVENSVETDPMSVINKILELEKEGKFKLKADSIDGMEQTMRAFWNQVGKRGYLHGGGISDITGLIQAGTNITITGNGTKTDPYIINASGGGGGTVTSVSVVSANGFAGTVANATTTPAITLSTTITGILKGNGTAISAAVAGTDYLSSVNKDSTLTGSGTSASALGINLANPNSWTAAQTILLAPAANTVADALILSDTTAASSGNQQYSGALHFIGKGWKTASTAASQSTDWRIYNVPVQGSTNPSSTLVIDSSINGGSYTAIMQITSGGIITSKNTGGGFSVDGAQTIAMSNVSGWLAMIGPANGFAWGPNGFTPGVNSYMGLFSSGSPGTKGLIIAGGLYYGFSSSGNTTDDVRTSDLFLTRRGAANLRLGYFDAAAPVAQILSVQSVVAGTTNTAGANFTISGSIGTGTGIGGDIILQIAKAGTTGTAQNSLSAALTIKGDTGTAVFGNAARLKGYTVATLPATPTQGDTAFCTDLLLPAFFAVAAGGGAVVGPVFFDGTNWITI